MNVTACLVTRGDVDMRPIIDSLPDHWNCVVWDNSKRHADLGIFGRYAAIAEVFDREPEVIYTQDDDVLVSCFDELIAAYEPGVLTVNYPEPYDIPWVACGALFDPDLPAKAFARYDGKFARDRWFTHFACDGVFSLLTERVKVIDHGYQDLPHGFAEGRVSTDPSWYSEKRPLIQTRCASVLNDR